MTISAQTPRSGPYSGNGSTTAFGYGFLVEADTEIVVTVADAAGTETVKTLTTDYTVSGVGNSAGGDVTFVTAPISTEQVVVTRIIALTQAVDLQNRKSVVPTVLETAYDKLTRIVQDQNEQLSRSVKVDLFGSTDLAALTVNINIVAGIASDVSTVAADGADIGVVAGLTTELTTVSGISANVTTVAGIAADVTTVAADGTDIGVVSGISANVTTVAGIAADVSTVAADGTDIGVVSGISANVTTVSGISANVTTVAGISADVTSVAAIDTDVTTVAANIAAVQGADAAATAAADSAAAAAASYDSFDDRYLGSKASAPTLDNDGNTLLEGAIYWNSTSSNLFIRTGTATWTAAVFDTAGAMFGVNNGSDFANVATVRTNIGVAIGTDVQAYALVLSNTTASYTTAEETKLTNIEAAADVTDTTNVTAAGALMDSEVTNLAQVKAFDEADYATAAQGTNADAAAPLASPTFTGVPAAPTAAEGTNTTQVATTAFVLANGVDVGAETALLAVGVVGSYAFLISLSGTAKAPGDNLGAASLRYSNASGSSGTQPAGGSWRCMGNTLTSGDSRASLWLRTV
jgi:hypothetical protein